MWRGATPVGADRPKQGTLAALRAVNAFIRKEFGAEHVTLTRDRQTCPESFLCYYYYYCCVRVCPLGRAQVFNQLFQVCCTAAPARNTLRCK
jgi:hypothetical protein